MNKIKEEHQSWSRLPRGQVEDSSTMGYSKSAGNDLSVEQLISPESTRRHKHHHGHEHGYHKHHEKKDDGHRKHHHHHRHRSTSPTKTGHPMDTLAMNAKSEAQVSITTGSTGEEIMMQQPVEQGHPMRNSVGPTPGAFHVGGGSGSEGSEDLDSEQPQNGDVEQGIVPSPLGTPTLEAHIVDEASEQARYNRLHEDLEKMREELSEERQQHKPPIMVPAVPVSFIEDCKSKLRWCFTFEFLTVILGCIGIALVISAITTAADPPLPPAFYDLVPLLESVLPERAATLSDPSSPQFQAAKWLAGNANFTAMSNQKRIQRYVLATLYFSTGGDKWFNKFGWLTDTDECDWWNSKWTEKENRTFCDGDGESLEMLFLNENNLRGQLPLELSLLSNSLVWVDFRNQQLQGPSFPTDLFLLTKLTRLELTLNPGIVGTLPSELVKLIALEYIGIGRMGIYGRLPTELGLLTGLETLGIEGNRHTGAIPTELGLATAIGELSHDYRWMLRLMCAKSNLICSCCCYAIQRS